LENGQPGGRIAIWRRISQTAGFYFSSLSGPGKSWELRYQGLTRAGHSLIGRLEQVLC